MKKIQFTVVAFFVLLLMDIEQCSLVVAQPVAEGLLQATLSDGPTGVSVATLSNQGNHFEALSKYESAANFSFSLVDTIAAARSAWALGLTDRAREIWDEVLSREDLSSGEKVREQLSRGILELQEGNYEAARSFAESAAYSLESSDLRSQLWLVVAESLKKQGALKRAEIFYLKASSEGSRQSRAEAQFLLGECQFAQGLLEQARSSFTQVPTASPYTGGALRRLTEIDFKNGNHAKVLSWIHEGQNLAPREFQDPWIFYVEVMSQIELQQMEKASQALERFKTHHQAGNPWYVLAWAAYSAKLIERIETKSENAQSGEA